MDYLQKMQQRLIMLEEYKNYSFEEMMKNMCNTVYWSIHTSVANYFSWYSFNNWFEIYDCTVRFMVKEGYCERTYGEVKKLLYFYDYIPIFTFDEICYLITILFIKVYGENSDEVYVLNKYFALFPEVEKWDVNDKTSWNNKCTDPRLADILGVALYNKKGKR